MADQEQEQGIASRTRHRSRSPTRGETSAPKQRKILPSVAENPAFVPAQQLVQGQPGPSIPKEKIVLANVWSPPPVILYRKIGLDEYKDFYVLLYDNLIEALYRGLIDRANVPLSQTEFLTAMKYGQQMRLCALKRPFISTTGKTFVHREAALEFPKCTVVLWDGLGKFQMNGGHITFIPMPADETDDANNTLTEFNKIRMKYIRFLQLLKNGGIIDTSTINTALQGTGWWLIDVFKFDKKTSATIQDNTCIPACIFPDPTPVDRLHAVIVCGSGVNKTFTDLENSDFQRNTTTYTYPDIVLYGETHHNAIMERIAFQFSKTPLA